MRSLTLFSLGLTFISLLLALAMSLVVILMTTPAQATALSPLPGAGSGGIDALAILGAVLVGVAALAKRRQ